MLYIFAFFSTLVVTFLATLVVRRLAWRLKIVDQPGGARKIHRQPVALLGGVAIFLGLVIVVGYYALFTERLFIGAIEPKHLLGVLAALSLIVIGGVLDDVYHLSPRQQIVWPLIATLIVIASGIGVKQITNPFDGVIDLTRYQTLLFWWQGLPYYLVWLADLLTFVWLMGMSYTTKLLDGLDGLVAGLLFIGAVMIFLLTTVTKFFQPDVALLATIVAGVALGFLFWNFYPARVFLGESGSIMAGFLLGLLAIISGGKIATALLVIGIPALDAAWVILRRLFWERRSPAQADAKHLHFRLLSVGFTQRQAVLLLYSIAAVFGATTLILQSFGKLLALGVLAAVMLLLVIFIFYRYRRRNA